MSIRSALLCVLFSLSSLAGFAAAADKPTVPVAPKKLIACAYVTVRETKLVSKATREFVAKTAREAIPAERFESLTVIKEDALAEARIMATAHKADVFLHVIVGEPKGIKYTRRMGAGPGRGRIGRGRRRRRTVTVEMPFWTLRSPVTVELSIADGKKWRPVRTTKLTSAEVPGAEEELPSGNEDISKAWPKAVGGTTRAGCEKALAGYFLRYVSLKPVKCGPAAAGDGGEDEKDAEAPGTLVKIELTNRSHCRILDATVTGEKYNESRKRWEAIDAPGGIRIRLPRRRRRGAEPDAQRLAWPIPADVDPGDKAFSMEVPVSDAVLLAMKNKKCRMVLHATPAVWKLHQPTHRHPLKPPPKATP